MYYKEFDFNKLHVIRTLKKQGYNKGEYSNCFIALDTETSKKINSKDNHIVAFSIAIRYEHKNICCLYGYDPIELIDCINNIRDILKGNIFLYVHNLAYDWVFIRRFFIDAFGEPVKQLNTKPHYPIFITFENGITLRDSLILSACNLEQWANDLDVEHKKAVGKWQYNKIRNQKDVFNPDEVLYVENDVLALVECLDKLCILLHKHVFSMPYTNTGIVRGELRLIGEKYNAHKLFLKIAPDFEQLQKLNFLFHGGYTHGNRYFYNKILRSKNPLIKQIIKCYDFCSSYPFSALAFKYPMTKFIKTDNLSINQILELSDKYAFMFKLIMIKPRLKDNSFPMPVLQLSKCVKVINPDIDNGRIKSADFVEIYLTEVSLKLINELYDKDFSLCTEIEYARKDYLPRWFTDYVYNLFKEKQNLKNVNKVLYGIAKSRLNSMYGCCVQFPLKDDIVEDYASGDFDLEPKLNEENYNKYLKRRTSILPYQWGVWITEYSLFNLFQLGCKCIDYDNFGEWIYSDTDSCFGYNWNEEKIKEYNDNCIRSLQKNGYSGVTIKDKTYHLGVAELEKECIEFICNGAKRYAYRDKDEVLHITIAGVPKKGVECLNNDLNNFVKGFIFKGEISGKLQVEYNFVDNVYTDINGNITGDSINLEPCDYELDSENINKYFQESIPMKYNYE